MGELKFILLLCVYYNFSIIHAESYLKYYDDYECNQPLIAGANVTATSSMSERGPENAILNGPSAWSPIESTYHELLTFNLLKRQKIKAIETQGRRWSKEFVSEYTILYSDDGDNFQSYAGNNGEIEMFTGNKDGDTIHRNEFEVPIIAQYVRVNPTRWRDKISLRVELYGCEYYSDTISFNGTSLVRIDLIREPISAMRESLRFRFKTAVASGVLVYSRGTQGDHYALELRENRLLLNIDLGSGMSTSLSVGSLLDDNLWHDVVVSRNGRDVYLSVDRVLLQGRIKGDLARLDLNRALYIGGVPNLQEGLTVNQNFTGCLENFYINSTNIIQELKQAFEVGEAHRYLKVHTILSNNQCPEPPVNPVTFLTPGSYVKLKGYEGVTSMNVSMEFRTYEENGLLIYHDFKSKGYVKVFIEEGKVKVELENDGRRAVFDNFPLRYNDGRWHNMRLTIGVDRLALTMDAMRADTARRLKAYTGAYYLIAGGKGGIRNRGFVGCMRLISVDGNYRLPADWDKSHSCCPGEIVTDACHMTDKCNPNPCEHGGICKQTAHEFYCECSGTGYAGAVCHSSINPLSCTAYKNVQSVGRSANVNIDVDGSGPLPAFPVICQFQSDGSIVTEVNHESDVETRVDGFQEPGSFRQDIQYSASPAQLHALLNRSHSCKQRLSYSCYNSRLLNSPSDEANYRPFAYWVSGGGQPMAHWAGALPASRKCACGLTGSCSDPTKWCNCDRGALEWEEDGGDITEKEFLPVKQVRFGDTGTHLDEKKGQYTLGPLLCEGDDLFSNVVMFRIADATINLPTFDMGHSGDIYLEFKTTKDNAVLFHATGVQDYIKLSIIGGDQIMLEFQAGNGPLAVSVETSSRLADNQWHSVHVERNRKEARVVVDGAQKNEVRAAPGPVRALQLSSPLVIGATIDYRDGFVGCIRALLLNGRPVDLVAEANRGLYGVQAGCNGRCDSNPCLNNGTCLEGYDGYACDCRWTAFKGPICADEIGVNLRPSSIIKYDFMGSWRSTIDEKLRVGFTTTNPKGFLLGLYSNITGEYLTLMVSNSGHLRVVFDFGFERQEVIFPNKHFALGQYHDVRLGRKNSGSTLVLQVDSYEVHEYTFNIKASADAQFNNIQYLYIGRNESMSEGFVGCVSRVEFDDIYPLKLLFQQSPPPNVRSLGSPLTEDFCGVEPITHPPIAVETRPAPIVDEGTLANDYHKTDEAILGTILALLFLMLLVVAFVVVRALARHKGEYLTQEERGAELAPDPDAAALRAATGPKVVQRDEFFI